MRRQRQHQSDRRRRVGRQNFLGTGGIGLDLGLAAEHAEGDQHVERPGEGRVQHGGGAQWIGGIERVEFQAAHRRRAAQHQIAAVEIEIVGIAAGQHQGAALRGGMAGELAPQAGRGAEDRPGVVQRRRRDLGLVRAVAHGVAPWTPSRRDRSDWNRPSGSSSASTLRWRGSSGYMAAKPSGESVESLAR